MVVWFMLCTRRGYYSKWTYAHVISGIYIPQRAHGFRPIEDGGEHFSRFLCVSHAACGTRIFLVLMPAYTVRDYLQIADLIIDRDMLMPVRGGRNEHASALDTYAAILAARRAFVHSYLCVHYFVCSNV